MPMSRSSPGTSSFLWRAPVAIITVLARYVPFSPFSFQRTGPPSPASAALKRPSAVLSGLLDPDDGVLGKFRSQPVRMLPEFHSQVKAVDSRKAGVIIYLVGGQHLSAADHLFFYYQCL